LSSAISAFRTRVATLRTRRESARFRAPLSAHYPVMSTDSGTPVPAVEQQIASLLTGSDALRYDDALRAIAAAFSAVSATLHRADTQASMLHMVAYLGLPPALIEIVKHIPFGKGIAGLCAVQKAPVELCNLQTDSTGAARPSAKQTGVAGAISVPVFGPDGALIGTLGVGKPQPHDYTEAEHSLLAACASLLGTSLAGTQVR
jgi:L-methionine (R)-S-oxide reductase